MTDSYYELIEDADALDEKFRASDLAVHVFHIPDGDWIGIRAETNYGPDGIGTTVGSLFDEQGAIGAIQQSVLVRRRPGVSLTWERKNVTVPRYFVEFQI